MRWLAVPIVLALVTAGCLGIGGDDGSDEPVQKARAVVTDDTGGIQGVVTDAAVQPIEGATVEIQELSTSTTTAEDGSYAFSELQPATYTLTVTSDEHLSQEKTVDVTAGEVATVDIVLTRQAAQDPFTQSFELKGFFECGFAAGYDLSPAPAPANMSGGLISSPTCNTLNSASGNATNDRFDHFFTLEGPIRSLVVETTWEPSVGALSDQLWVDIVPQGFHCGNITMCEWSLIDHWGPSPLTGHINNTTFQQEQAYFDRRCENGVDEWCGYDFREDGWPLWIRVYARWECTPAGAQACVLAQQEFTHILTAFYHEPAPEGFTALE